MKTEYEDEKYVSSEEMCQIFLINYVRYAVALRQGSFNILCCFGPKFLLEPKELVFQDMLVGKCSQS